MIDRFVLASFALLVLTLGPGCASGSWGTDYSGAAGTPGARRVQTDVLQLPATPAAPAAARARRPRGESDAAAVAGLYAEGAVIIGKTVSTEFAY